MNENEARFITDEEAIKLVSSNDRLPWETKGLKYVQEQRGAGKRTLCKDCNNLTGAYYGDVYCKFAKEFAAYLQQESEKIETAVAVELKIKNFYPLQFAKQVLSMFCSTTEGLSDHDHEIRKILLHKEEKLMNPNFKLSMFLVKNQVISWTGLNVFITLEKNELRSLSEIIAYPFGFIFDYDGNYEDGSMLDITNFLSYGYDQEVTFRAIIPIHEKNMMFPGDFRTKEEVLKTIERNKKYAT